MSKIFFITTLFMINGSLFQAQGSPSPATIPPGSEVHFHTHHHAAPVNVHNNHNLETAANSYAQATAQADITQNLTDWMLNKQESCYKHATHATEIIKQHKIATTATCLAALYTAIWIDIYQTYCQTYKQNSWATWLHEIPLTTFLTQQQKTVAPQLIRDIQHRYLDHNNPTDFIAPLISFSAALHQEITATEKLQSLYEWIRYCYSSKLFFIEEKHIEDLEYRLNRLYFIKHVFTTWSTDYKLEHNHQEQ